MIDIPGIYVGRFKTDPNNRPALMTRAASPTYTNDNWANVESTGTIWRYSSETGEWVDTGLEEILVEEVTGTKEIVAEGTVPWNLQGLKVYGKSTQVSTTGAQLFDVSSIYDVQKPSDFKAGVIPIYVYGVYTGFTADGYWSEDMSSYSFDQKTNTFTVTGRSGYGIGILVPCNPSSNYCFSLGNQDQMEFAVAFYNQSGNLIRFSSNTNPKIFTTTEDCYYLMLVLRPTGTGRYRNLMLNSGSAVLPWEPYTGGKPSPSPDYPQEIVTAGSDGDIDISVSDGVDQSQQLSISTPNGLPGIPISSGGNYTNASGQQWICDEVDFEKGVYRKTVGVIENYQSESINEPCMSTTGQLSIGAKVIYPLSQQEETPLTESQLQAYKALMSYDGTTKITADEDISGMSAKVVTDVISKNAWFDPYAELALYYKALAGFASLEDLPMPHSRESSLVRKLLDSSYELEFTVTDNSSRNERYLWDLINGTTSMLTNVPKSDTEKFLHVMIGGTVEEYPTVDTELDYWMDKCVNYMSSNGSIGE